MVEHSSVLRHIFRPDSGKGPAVLIIHSWWGLTPSFTNYGKALARAGLIAGVPDLFEGATADTEADARMLRARPRATPTYRTLINSITELRNIEGVQHGPIGVVGFSMGGHWAVWLSQRAELPIASVVLYYACRAGNFAECRASYMAHFADSDPWVRPSAHKRMEQALSRSKIPYTAYDYPGTQHWFAESDRRTEYSAKNAQLALRRSSDHLLNCLG